jgi:hypothetical protein
VIEATGNYPGEQARIPVTRVRRRRSLDLDSETGEDRP